MFQLPPPLLTTKGGGQYHAGDLIERHRVGEGDRDGLVVVADPPRPVLRLRTIRDGWSLKVIVALILSFPPRKSSPPVSMSRTNCVTKPLLVHGRTSVF